MTVAAQGEPAVTVDGTGLLCVRLLLKLRGVLDALPAGTLVHVTTTDPAAPLDLPAWCDLTGHRYRGRLADADPPTHAVVVAEDPRPTRPDRPWHPM
jgi:tRNA 2-thiouridine synthesizing protein A